jgi:hypothetical protein
MGESASPHTAGESGALPEVLNRFARALRDRYGARLYLFGSHVRGDHRPDSDFDLIAVADAFADQPQFGRAPDRRDLWRSAGGTGLALDLHCLTRAEFRDEVASGFGAIGSARKHGEMRLMRSTRPRRRVNPSRVLAGALTPD